ncbi:MAG: carboxypeptidase regulatory-like domain-containing protein, partial [Thermoplasmata archaeon]
MNTMAAPDNVYVDGYVLENGSGSIIENATVILQNTWDGTTNTTKTNATGYYSISIHAPPGGEVFQITVFHEDYHSDSQYMWLAEGTNQTDMYIYLDPAMNKNSVVYGRILDAVTMTPLPFTGIAALGENYINSTGSDATAYYQMSLESNQYYYVQVEKSGYENQIKSSYFNFGDTRRFDFLM